jgi:prevent-host-death family protein
MARFNVHDAKTNFSRLLEMAERGGEVIVARNGKPIARLVGLEEKKSILGIGIEDPNYRDLADEEAFSPMSPDEAEAFYEGRR